MQNNPEKIAPSKRGHKRMTPRRAAQLTVREPSINSVTYELNSVPVPKRQRYRRPTPYGQLQVMRIESGNLYGELSWAIRKTLYRVIGSQERLARLSKQHQRIVQAMAALFFTHAYHVKHVLVKLKAYTEQLDDSFWGLLGPCVLKAALRETLQQFSPILVQIQLKQEVLEIELRRERFRHSMIAKRMAVYADALEEKIKQAEKYKLLYKNSKSGRLVRLLQGDNARYLADNERLRHENAVLKQRLSQYTSSASSPHRQLVTSMTLLPPPRPSASSSRSSTQPPPLPQ